MTIYIMTDIPQDARDICTSYSIPWNNGNIRGNSENKAVWINCYTKILGRKITKKDTIVWGDFNNLELWGHLTYEIERRVK